MVLASLKIKETEEQLVRERERLLQGSIVRSHFFLYQQNALQRERERLLTDIADSVH